jgi:hypothetical protein
MLVPGLSEGTPVVVYLHSPKEKVWGVLLSLTAAGVLIRGIELEAFDDWMRQEAHGEEALIGLLTVFYPMGRVVRIERDESVGPVISYADRFAREVGRSVAELLGIEPRKN